MVCSKYMYFICHYMMNNVNCVIIKFLSVQCIQARSKNTKNSFFILQLLKEFFKAALDHFMVHINVCFIRIFEALMNVIIECQIIPSILKATWQL